MAGDQGQLLLLQPLNLDRNTKVRSRISLLDDDFDPDADSKEQILIDLKESLRQAEAGQTFPISALWNDINV